MPGLIVHEWIEKNGGSENVVDSMVAAYPDSEIFCLWNNAPHRYPNNRVIESRLSKRIVRGKKALTVPFMNSTWRQAQLPSYDWALVSSHVFAHHIAANKRLQDTPTYAYIHSPARYIWEPELDDRGQNLFAKIASPYFRHIDKKAAANGQIFAANSKFVRERIRRVWDQDSEVVYPPVQIRRIQKETSWASSLNEQEAEVLNSLPNDFILGASRFIEYKRLSVVIRVGEACQLPVVLAGSGPSIDMLRIQAENSDIPVRIIERPSDRLLYALYERAMLFVFPPVEDFGIMPVEAMALGTPVLVNAVGGASESASLLGGGVSMNDWHTSSIIEAVDTALMLDMKDAIAKSKMFSHEAFTHNLKTWMDLVM